MPWSAPSDLFARVVWAAHTVTIAVLLGGLMIGARDLDHGRPLRLAHLLAGLRRHGAQLLLLGALEVLGTLTVAAVAAAMSRAVTYGQGLLPPDSILAGTAGTLLPILLGASLYLPLVIAGYFAPTLITVYDQKALSALRTSLAGALKNIPAFLVYILVVIPLCTLVMLPLSLGGAFTLCLGVIMLLPILTASLYVAARDMFTDRAT